MFNEDQINLIEDNNFLNTDVSDLVTGDFYLFHIENSSGQIYFYKDGRIFSTIISGESVDDIGIVLNIAYTKGTLQEYIDRSIKK